MKIINKKGFTLVELLAVIVILALIMAIAVVSMSGIMTSARQSAFKETAVQIINGVQQQLTLANELLPSNQRFWPTNTGTGGGIQYYVEKSMIEKGGETAPLGGKYQFFDHTTLSANSTPKNTEVKAIGTAGLYRNDADNVICTPESKIFVTVKYNSTDKNFKYSICVPTGEGTARINNGTLEQLLDNNNTIMID